MENEFLVRYATGLEQLVRSTCSTVERFCNEHFGSTWPEAQAHGAAVTLTAAAEPPAAGAAEPPAAGAAEPPAAGAEAPVGGAAAAAQAEAAAAPAAGAAEPPAAGAVGQGNAS